MHLSLINELPALPEHIGGIYVIYPNYIKKKLSLINYKIYLLEVIMI